jgi:hypothetical protein
MAATIAWSGSTVIQQILLVCCNCSNCRTRLYANTNKTADIAKAGSDIHNIFGKIGVSTRLDASIWAADILFGRCQHLSSGLRSSHA